VPVVYEPVHPNGERSAGEMTLQPGPKGVQIEALLGHCVLQDFYWELSPADERLIVPA